MNKGYKFKTCRMYVVVNFQGQKIMYVTASCIIVNGGSWSMSRNGKEDLSMMHEITK
jgi:hypothetical protein